MYIINEYSLILNQSIPRQQMGPLIVWILKLMCIERYDDFRVFMV
jgi:hypothetical protein